MQLMRGGSLDRCIAWENIKAFVAARELEHDARSFAYSAMTLAHVGNITQFLWGQRHPPGDF